MRGRDSPSPTVQFASKSASRFSRSGLIGCAYKNRGSSSRLRRYSPPKIGSGTPVLNFVLAVCVCSCHVMYRT
jgi:hypothetical protein